MRRSERTKFILLVGDAGNVEEGDQDVVWVVRDVEALRAVEPVRLVLALVEPAPVFPCPWRLHVKKCSITLV